MWLIEKIKIRNFRSFLEDEYEFLQDRTTLIFGKHNNAEFSNSNGTGKSSFLKAVEFALFGVVSRVLPKEEYIHNGEKECSVAIWLHNPALKKEMIIRRMLFRTKSKPARVVVFINGEENTELINEVEANQFIESVLKINREDLLNYFLVGQSNQMSFLRATDARQKEIIARFANVDALDTVLLDIKALSGSLEADLAVLRSNNRKIEGKIELLDEQLSGLEETENDTVGKMRVELDRFIEQQQDKIRQYEASRKEWEEALADRKTKYAEFKALVDKHDKTIHEQIAKQQAELRLLKQELNHMRHQVDGQIECPNCQHKFVLGEEIDVTQLPALISETEDVVQQMSIAINTLEQQEEQQRNEVRKSKSLRSGVEEAASELELIAERLGSIQKRIGIKQEEFAKVQKESSNPVEDMAKRLKADRAEQIALIEKNNAKILDLDRQLDEYRFWSINFGVKGFKTFLINRVLELLQANINFYLAKISTFQVRMEGYKVLADGSLRDKITVLVSKDGDNWEHYEKFSGGQQTRIDICAVLALRRIINQNAIGNGGGLNFLGLDEAFDGLDNMGQKHVIETLEGIGETCLVISHSNDNVAFKNKMVITLDKSGVSKIT